eukprot:3215867-Pyramimonas_sp.AAC.1
MSVADTLIADIRTRVQFVLAQAAAGLNQDQLLTSQAHAIALAIRQQRGISMDVAAAVTREVVTGPWSAEDKTRLATVLSNAASAVGHATEPRKQQKFKYPELFLK